MKSLKYVIISLLLISIFKKTTPMQENTVENHTVVTTSHEPALKNTRHSDREIETKKQHLKRYRSTVKKYNPDKKTATANAVYVGVEEHGQATTPPNVVIPAMVPFGTITEKHTPQQKQLLGGKIHITTLWGIPVYGHRKPIKETEQNLTIGYLWLNQDSVFGIAQMNDGKTFVGVIDDHMPNYIQRNAESHRKTGLVWNWYTHQDIAELQEKYGILPPSSETVKEIGTAKINRQRYKLYGIKLPSIDDIAKQAALTQAHATTASTFSSKAQELIHQKPNIFNLYNEPKQEMHPLILNYLAKNWLTKNSPELP